MAESPPSHTSPNISVGLAYFMIATAVFLWAISVVIARGVHDEIPLIGLTFWRWIIAVFVLAPFVWKDVWRNIDIVRKHWHIYLAQGVYMVGGATFLFLALNYTTAINASLVNTAQPAVTAFLTWLILKDRLKNIQYLGIASAIAGVMLMIARADLATFVNLDFNGGDFLVILAIISYSMYAVNLRKLPTEMGTFSTLFVILFFGTFPLLPFYIGETILYRPVDFNMLTVGTSFVLAIIVSIGSLALWNNGNRVVGPHRAAVFVSLMPVFGSVLAVFFLGEELFIYHIIGAVFVCTGIFMVVRNH